MTDNQLMHVYREIALGRGGHGEFLRKFAEAILQADPQNFALMRDHMVTFVLKYRLDKYLDTFEADSRPSI